MRTASEEIAALVYAYAAAIDVGDFAALADLFTHATLRSDGRPEVRRGRDEVLALYESMVRLYDGRPGTKHVTTNLVVDLDPDEAENRVGEPVEAELVDLLRTALVDVDAPADQLQRLGLG